MHYIIEGNSYEEVFIILLALICSMGFATTALAVGDRSEIHWGILAGIETVDLIGTLDMGGNVPMQRYDVYMTMDSLISGLMNGRSDACYINKSIAEYITNRNSGIESEVMPDQGQLRFMMGVNANKPELHERLNNALKELIADGTVKRLTEEWIDHFPADREPDFQGSLHVEGATETIVVGVTGDMPPIDYMAVNGTPSGFNVALLQALGQKMGVNIALLSLASEARIVALAAGRIDVAFWINSVDAFQGDFIDGVLLTEPYASSEICMIYTAGQRDRIMRMTNQIHAVERILAVSDEEELYTFGQTDPYAIDALVSLIFEAPEMTLDISQSGDARAWALSLGETQLASGVRSDNGQLTSTLTPGVALTLSQNGAPQLENAMRDAVCTTDPREIDGQSYSSSASVRFSLTNDALYTIKPVFAYLEANGNVHRQAADMLELSDMEFAGSLYRNETDDRTYLDASSVGVNGSRARFFGTYANGQMAYTLLLVKGGVEFDDATARAEIQDGSLEGMALEINIQNTDTETSVNIDGISTNFGMLYVPSTRFAISGQQTADKGQCTFSVLGIDVNRVAISRQDGNVPALDEALVLADIDEVTSEAVQSSAKQGLDALYESLASIAPLTGDYLKSIMEIAQ